MFESAPGSPAGMRTDCRLYRGSAPCEPHKADGRPCAGCDAYDPIGDHVLVVKLGAMGDVLRTAALLPDIAGQHDRPAITWITRRESLDVLAGNPLVHRSVAADEAMPLLATRRFAAVYALDADEDGLALARLASAEVRRGYRAGEHGTAVGVEPGGDDKLFRLGLSDADKRANRRSYVDLLARTAGLRWSGGRPVVALRERDVAGVRAELAELPRPWIGVNGGASSRWEHKRWTAQHAGELVVRLHQEGMGTILFGEGADLDDNRALAARFGPGVRAFESAGSPRRLFAAIAQLDALVTTDTLAMHAAWALRRPVVALFGPTSAAEIDLDPADVKLTAALPCLACYLHTCAVEPHCMELLDAQTVFGALRSRLAVRSEVATA